MAKIKENTTLVRKDDKGRILHLHEYQRKDGRYMFTYMERGKLCHAYSMRLKASDPMPPGGTRELSLREKEEQINHDLYEGTPVHKSKITVLELVRRYTEKKHGVRRKTRENYQYIIRKIDETELGNTKVVDVTVSMAKDWCIMMQQKGYKYNSLRAFRGVLKPAFETAYEDDLIRKNPFNFNLSDVLTNDAGKREPLTEEEVAILLEFARNDFYVSKYADGLSVLLESGIRVAEFCGLTLDDIDFENNVLRIERQLVRGRDGSYAIEEPKTESGKRVIPLTKNLREVLERLIANRHVPEVEPEIDGVKGFLFYTKKGTPFVAHHWQTRFVTIRKRYFRETEKDLKLSPHVCRHTFCTFMALRGMNLKVLQYIMGHSRIAVTLDTYTHTREDDAKAEIRRMEELGLLK